MGWKQRTAAGIAGGLVVLAAGTGWLGWRMLPPLDGTLTVTGLKGPVDVRRDSADVTHIEAGRPQDVWFALGYVHAQERGWQLAFNRRLMHGTLSEVFGSATLDTDRLIRALDIRGAAERQLAALPVMAQEAMERYAAGIRAFFQDPPQQWPPEFLLLGMDPGSEAQAAWTAADSVGWALMMALDLGGNWGQELTRLNLSAVLDNERLWQLLPPYPGETPATTTDLPALYRSLQVAQDTEPATEPLTTRPSAHPPAAATAPSRGAPRTAPAAGALSSDRLAESQSPSALQLWAQAFNADAGSHDGRGSNNWVIAGSRTRSGKPLLANDPHLGLNAPAIWYFAALQAPAGTARDGTAIAPIDAIGATLPGLPFVVLGRTGQVAWGFTNTGPDVQDLYLEQIDPHDPSRYRTPDGWAHFQTRTETIRVKDAPDVTVTYRATRHGPVLSDGQRGHEALIDLDRYVLALRWTALDTDNTSVLAGLRTNQARNVDELFEALSLHTAPMQSVVAADTQGTIRMRAMGRVPVRGPEHDLRGMAPAPGWLARYDWQGWIPLDELPRDDGEAGWIATANQRIVGPDYPHFLTQDWSLPYRYDRIAQRLDAEPRHDAGTQQALQADLLSAAALQLLPTLQRTGSSHPLAPAAQALLADFDGVMAADRAAPLILAVWIDELTREVIGPQIGAARLQRLYGKRDFRAGLEGILARNDPFWCGQRDCLVASGVALDRALDRLRAQYGDDPSRWRWGDAHPAVSEHRPFGRVASLAWLFNVRTPTGGDGYTVNVGQYHTDRVDEPFANRHAASMRTLYDLADPEQSLFIFQTGQSGLMHSTRYRDMAGTWAAVDYRPLQQNPRQWDHHLTLQPGP